MSQGLLTKNSKGFTLVEMMVALLILSVSILALTSVTILTIRVNLENDTRNAAVRLVSEVTEDLFRVPFGHADLATTTPGSPHTRTYTVNLRGTEKDFDAEWEVVPTGGNVRQISITIFYTLKGTRLANRAVVFRARAS